MDISVQQFANKCRFCLRLVGKLNIYPRVDFDLFVSQTIHSFVFRVHAHPARSCGQTSPYQDITIDPICDKPRPLKELVPGQAQSKLCKADRVEIPCSPIPSAKLDISKHT